MLPKRMKDLDNSAYYARYIEAVKGLPIPPRVFAARPSDFSHLLTKLNLGPDARLIRGNDSLKPGMALITKELLVPVQ
jgi:hypothetical protein